MKTATFYAKKTSRESGHHIEFENCYCRRQRKQYIETTDYRNTPEYKEWRVAVFSRDGFACQICCVTGGDLNAHHIKSYKTHPKERFNIENGIVLCESCHRGVHKKIKAFKNIKIDKKRVTHNGR